MHTKGTAVKRKRTILQGAGPEAHGGEALLWPLPFSLLVQRNALECQRLAARGRFSTQRTGHGNPNLIVARRWP